jgi:predicted transglutaminase-like cysteine proteinase
MRRWRWKLRSAGLLLAAAILVPAAGASQPPAGDRDLLVTARIRPNLFGTVAIPGPGGRWSDKWQKVASSPVDVPALAALVAPARGLSRLEQLRYLQQVIDRRVGWRSDGTQYGARIYWASAEETLASGRGDDDDRAILKFQALRALGYPAGDFYLVMGRDRVRGDYVLLAARAEGRWWLLEEQGDRPVEASTRTGFEPIASFGAGRSFIHGRLRPQLARSNRAPANGSSAP